MCNERIAFLHSLIIWRDFGRGWSKRVADVRLVSLALAGEPPIIMADGETRPNRKPRGALIAPPPLPRHPPKDEFEAAARAAEKED
jgi:hypothetical protein